MQAEALFAMLLCSVSLQERLQPNVHSAPKGDHFKLLLDICLRTFTVCLSIVFRGYEATMAVSVYSNCV